MSPRTSESRVAPYGQAVPAVRRAMAALEQLAGAPDGLALAELSRAVRVSPSSLLAILRTLERQGYVAQDPTSRRYHVALPLVVLGRQAAQDLVPEAIFRQLARPLAKRLGETVSLWTLYGSQAVLVAAEEGPRQARFAPRPGLHWSAGGCALGHALLAGLSPARVAEWYAQTEEPGGAEVGRRASSHGEGGLLPWPALIERLARVREVGYADEHAATEPGLYVLGVPVPGTWRGASLAVAYAAPRAERPAEADRIARALGEVAEALVHAAQAPSDSAAVPSVQAPPVWLSAAAGPMSPAERQAFLDGPWLATLACLKENGYPYSVPVWYQWQEGRFWVVPRARAEWARYLELNPRVSLAIGEPVPPLRRALVEGRAEPLDGPQSADRAARLVALMAARYLGPAAPAYLEATASQARRVFALVPEKLVTWRGLAPHPRYDAAPGEPAARPYGRGVA
ncbi:MAG: helix-turn-helix domain-containing protein [Chloroflexi bacterium]|nr:helix-turn-helix domain-containing protein [Chloroflexota bacterium]